MTDDEDMEFPKRAVPLPARLQLILGDENERPNKSEELIALKSMYVDHPAANEMMNEIRNIHRLYNNHGESEADYVLILGRSGVGKTRSIRHFTGSFKPVRTKAGLFRPVAHFDAPPDCSKSGLLKAAVAALGMPIIGAARLADLEAILKHQLKAQGVQLLVIDEMNSMIDRRTNNFQYQASEQLKALINANSCQMVYAGTEIAEAIREVNHQVGRRGTTFDLNPYDLYTAEGRKKFRNFLTSVARAIDHLAIFESKPNLADSDLSRRLHVATEGLVGLAMKIVIRATEIAANSGAALLDREHFAIAFDKFKRRGMKVNPFVGECPARLDISVDYMTDGRATARRLLGELRPGSRR